VQDVCTKLGVLGSGNQTESFKFLSDPPLLPWQQVDVIWTL